MAILKNLLSPSKSLLSMLPSKSKPRSTLYDRLIDHTVPPSSKEKQGSSCDSTGACSKGREFASKRLRKELRKFLADDVITHCSYGPVNEDDPFRLQATIIGPSDTPFDGGVFFLTVDVPHEYPFKPPHVKFQTKVFHPNVGLDGTIYIDILDCRWTPALTIHKLLLSICSFLPDPDHEKDGCNSTCNLYWNKRRRYDKIARNWTLKYAMV